MADIQLSMNDPQLLILACNNFYPEISQAVEETEIENIGVRSFPCSCNHPSALEGFLNQLTHSNKPQKMVVIGSMCISPTMVNKLEEKNVEFIRFNQCFEIFENGDLIHHYLREGNYIVTPGWLKNLPKHKDEWGFDKDTAHAFFHETAKNILYLDTGVLEDQRPNLQRLSEYTGLPFTTIPIGLEHCKLLIQKTVLQWLLDTESTHSTIKIADASRTSAEYSLVFRELNPMMDELDQERILDKVKSLLQILFAPRKIEFRKSDISEKNKRSIIPTKISLRQVSATSIEIHIVQLDEYFGSFILDGIMFPEYIPQYRDLSESIARICALAISHSKKFNAIIETSEELKVMTEQLTELNDSKDTFFSIIGHDLRSPFNAILGISELLDSEDTWEDASYRKTMTRNLRLTAENTYNLVLNILDWSSAEAGRMEYKPKVFRLDEIIKNNCELFAYQSYNKNLSCELSDLGDIQLYADSQMIDTVLRNLISNSVKFTPTGGSISIQAERMPIKPGEEALIKISITDTGVGMSEEQIEAFNNLQSTQSTLGTLNEKGSGLGLRLCRQLVEKNHGTMMVKSTEGEGSRFSILLPAAPGS